MRAQGDEGEAAAQVSFPTLSQVDAGSYNSRGAEVYI